MPAYSAGIYPIVFGYGRAGFDVKDGALVDSWGRTFRAVSASGAIRTYRAQLAGTAKAIEVDADPGGAVLQWMPANPELARPFRSIIQPKAAGDAGYDLAVERVR